jgi:hypothetical protein
MRAWGHRGRGREGNHEPVQPRRAAVPDLDIASSANRRPASSRYTPTPAGRPGTSGSSGTCCLSLPQVTQRASRSPATITTRLAALCLLCGCSGQLGLFPRLRFRFALVTFSPAPFVGLNLPANRSVLAKKLVNAEHKYPLVS